MENIRNSILQMARGAFLERADYEMEKVINNILDPNTKATAKRKITMALELVPDEERSKIHVSVTAKSVLVATNPVTTSLCITNNADGELVVAEIEPQIPGQMQLNGQEQEAPRILKLAQKS